jgi:hypothetical protein
MPAHATGCLLCGEDLAYATVAQEKTCDLCHVTASSTAACIHGHFICDACHRGSAADVIEQLCRQTTSVDPIALSTELMRSPVINMHGPEHHFLVPAVLLATYDNAQGRSEQKQAHLAVARQRADRLPGGFCGTHGNCGAAVGTGVFWAIVSGATPLSCEPWSQSNRMTARSLLRIADYGGPRCCKRDCYLAILAAMEELSRLDGVARSSTTPTCEHSVRNRECTQSNCPFFPVLAATRKTAEMTPMDPPRDRIGKD